MNFGFLTLNVLPADSLEVEKICEIHRESPLFEHMIQKRFIEREHNEQTEKFYNYMTAVPRMFTLNGNRFIAFSHHKESPKVLIFDVNKKKVTFGVKNAEIFLHSIRE